MMGEFSVALRQKIRNFYLLTLGGPLKPWVAAIDRWLRNRNRKKTVVVTRDGVVYQLDLSQMIDNIIYYNGCFEPEMVEAFSKLIKPGMTVLDIGANVGAHTFRLAKLVGKEGRVIAFEPTEWAFSKIKDNAELNSDLENVELENLALSDQDADNESYAFRSQWDEYDETDKEKGEINFLTLDTYCRERQIIDVDFIKLDVDGYETKILRGSKHVLKSCRPILIVEMSVYWQETVGDSIDDLISILDEIGYRYFDVNGFVAVEDPVATAKALEGDEAINVVCFPIAAEGNDDSD